MESAAWEQQGPESDLWYSRFHDHYLILGPERSLEQAYRKYRESQQETGIDPVSRRPTRKLPGSWRAACAKWRWLERARAYDDQQRAQLRKAQYEAIKKANERHQGSLRAAFAKVLQRLQSISPEDFTATQTINHLLALIDKERQVLGMPLQIELTHKGADPDSLHERAATEATAEAERRFSATPEQFAAVPRVLAAHENKSYETDDGTGVQDRAGAQGPDGPDRPGSIEAKGECPAHQAEPDLPELQPEATRVPGP